MLKLQRKNMETERLILQPYAMHHHHEVFRLIGNNRPDLVHSFPKLLAATETLHATRDYVQHKIFDWNKNKSFCCHIFLKETGTLIGHFNIKDIRWKQPQCELSYFIDRCYQRQGLAGEALRRVLQVCFSQLHMRHVSVRIVPANTASRRLAERSGLQYEGTFYNDYRTYDRQTVDTYRYGITQEDFKRSYLQAL
jgi:RimJ/RimL family protein N-acetyltransferase